MAKVRPGRSSISQLLRLRRLTAFNQVAGHCAISPVACAFTPSRSNWLQRDGCVKLSVAKASDGDRVCGSSKQGPLHDGNRQLKRKQQPIPRPRAPWSPLTCGGGESQASK
jgi:hypothetical protein